MAKNTTPTAPRGRGRPKIPAENQRHSVTLRLTAAEYADLKALADRLNCSRSKAIGEAVKFALAKN